MPDQYLNLCQNFFNLHLSATKTLHTENFHQNSIGMPKMSVAIFEYLKEYTGQAIYDYSWTIAGSVVSPSYVEASSRLSG